MIIKPLMFQSVMLALAPWINFKQPIILCHWTYVYWKVIFQRSFFVLKLVACNINDQSVYNKPGMIPSVIQIITIICSIDIYNWANAMINKMLS